MKRINTVYVLDESSALSARVAGAAAAATDAGHQCSNTVTSDGNA